MRYRSPRARQFQVTTWDGIPVYVDWTVVIGVLLVCGGIAFTVSAVVGFFVLVLCHELGHAALVRMYGYRVSALVIHGFGGECEYTGQPSRWELAVIAWGGVLGQALLFLAIYLPIEAGLVPEHIAKSGFTGVAAGYNLFAGIVNLLPLRGLDGEHAWKILRLSYLRAKHRYLAARLRGASDRKQRSESDKHLH